MQAAQIQSVVIYKEQKIGKKKTDQQLFPFFLTQNHNHYPVLTTAFTSLASFSAAEQLAQTSNLGISHQRRASTFYCYYYVITVLLLCYPC